MVCLIGYENWFYVMLDIIIFYIGLWVSDFYLCNIYSKREYFLYKYGFNIVKKNNKRNMLFFEYLLYFVWVFCSLCNKDEYEEFFGRGVCEEERINWVVICKWWLGSFMLMKFVIYWVS